MRRVSKSLSLRNRLFWTHAAHPPAHRLIRRAQRAQRHVVRVARRLREQALARGGDHVKPGGQPGGQEGAVDADFEVIPETEEQKKKDE